METSDANVNVLYIVSNYALTSNFTWQLFAFTTQGERTALRRWIWNLSTSPIPGAQSISSSSPNSTEQSTRPSDLPLSALAKSSPVMCIFTMPMRKINGDTRRDTGFSLTHMPTVSFQEAGERKMALVGQGNTNVYPYIARKNTWCRSKIFKPNMPYFYCCHHSRWLVVHLILPPNSVIIGMFRHIGISGKFQVLCIWAFLDLEGVRNQFKTELERVNRGAATFSWILSFVT